MITNLCNWFWKLGLIGALSVVLQVPVLTISKQANAQMTPDSTLAGESSVIVPNVIIDNLLSERVDGGAIRGANLFHSFQEFNVGEGRGVYFSNPSAVENIFSRVTGANSSNILGRLGVLGNANLYLMNPNGIVFGQNASLDVEGSFVATTANAIKFGNTGLFSASEPASSNLLSINPSALFYNVLNNAEIVNRSQNGLNVDEGRSLLLVGGKVKLENGVIKAPGGRVELGGLNSPGDIAISQNGNNLGLSLPNGVDRADVLLTNASEVNVRSNGNGSIAVNAKDVEISSGSALRGGINSGSEFIGAVAGDITLNATGKIEVAQGSVIENNVNSGAVGKAGNIDITTGSLLITGNAWLTSSTYGQGNAGGVTIKARDAVTFDTGSIFSTVESGGKGDGGDIKITAGSLSLMNGGQVNAFVRNASNGQPAGVGNAGNVIIKVNDAFTITGFADKFSGIFNSLESGATGSAGNIDITTGSLSITGNAGLVTSTYGQGNAGSVTIKARDAVTFDSGSAFSTVEPGGKGDGGNIKITAGLLSLINGGQVNAFVRGASANIPAGIGNAGNVIIKVNDAFTISGFTNKFSGIFNFLDSGATGSAGNIDITTGSLLMRDGARIDARVSGNGDGGKVNIKAQEDIVLDNANNNGLPTSILANVEKGAVGDAGDINITTGNLSVSNGALIESRVRGTGDGGQITINANDKISFDGSRGIYNSGIYNTLEFRAAGKAGDVNIKTGSLSMKNGARIDVGTSGSGDGGKVDIKAQEEIVLDSTNNDRLPTSILANVEEGAVGDAGDINITTGNLSVTNGALIESRVRGTGDGGQITINANDKISFDGVGFFFPNGAFLFFASGAFSSVEQTGVGKGGNIQITTGSLSLTDGAQLRASIYGQGDAGNVVINARERVSFDGVVGFFFPNGDFLPFPSGALSNVEQNGVGKGGNIHISADSVSFDNGGRVYARVQDNAVGNGGNITIKTGSFFAARSSELEVSTRGQGNSGNIKIQAGEFLMTSNAALIADLGTGGTSREGGNINLMVDGSVSLIGGKTEAETAFTGESTRITLGVQQGGKGSGGNLTINANSLVLKDGALIKASTQGEGAAGKININTNIIDISGSNPISGLASGLFTSTDTSFNAGNIIINTDAFQISESAGLSARSRGNGQGGDITVNAKYFEAISGGQLVTTTTGNGKAGNILINAKDQVTISGIDQKYNTRVAQVQANKERISNTKDVDNPSFQLSLIANNTTETGAASGLFAQTDNSSGGAGDVTITTQQLTLTDQAQISAATSSSGQGGDIDIRSNSLTLNRGEISARTQGVGNAGSITIDADGLLSATDSKIVTSAQQSSGGAIKIEAGDIRLYGNSDITTNVESGAGDSGNITLTANSIIAFGDSDILAFARDGQGGDISLKTPAFFGQNYKAAPRGTEPSTLDGNNRVDINASGAISGTITLPDTSFIQNSLSELPENLIDTASLIANSCIARANNQQQGTFIITGSGALPSRPGDALMSQYTFGSVRTNNVSASSRRPWQKGDPIIEPQGAYRLPSGHLVLSRECG